MKPRHWLLIAACLMLLYPIAYAFDLYNAVNLIITDSLIGGAFFAFAVLVAAWTVLEVLSRLPLRERTGCRACGYDLSSQKCPECGARRDQQPSKP